jgi:hypothetical protein
MNQSNREIRDYLQQYPVPSYDPEKMQQTIQLARQAYCNRLLSKRIGFGEFIRMQMHFIGHWVWFTQAALVLGFLILLTKYDFGQTNLQQILLLFSAASPMIAFVGFPELLKSYSHGMEEIESCTRFSMRKLMGARMLILGLMDLFCLTVILAVSTVHSGGFLLRTILYLFVPFNLTCGGCLTVLSHVKSRQSGYYCGAVCALCIAVFVSLSFIKRYYETTATGAWVVMFILTLVYIAVEVVHTFQSFNRFYSKEEAISVTWQ